MNVVGRANIAIQIAIVVVTPDRNRAPTNESVLRIEGVIAMKDLMMAATIAGAAIGGFTGHKAKRDNWVPAAIGAVVGGLVAREGEKEFYKRKEYKKEEKEMEQR